MNNLYAADASGQEGFLGARPFRAGDIGMLPTGAFLAPSLFAAFSGARVSPIGNMSISRSPAANVRPKSPLGRMLEMGMDW